MPSNVSVVLTCAGVGSRLGLGQTKSLVILEGRPLIQWQLELFREVEDLRIVVGFQAADVIDEVRKTRPDAVFVNNRNYFETKTGASFYLGARHAGDYVVEWDGDLLVHPDDAKLCLYPDGEYLGYSDISSEDAVFVSLNKAGSVTGFSREYGDYEWTGPACLRRDRIKYTSENVFNQFLDYLPVKGIKIRACDVDTYGDYLRAKEFVNSW